MEGKMDKGAAANVDKEFNRNFLLALQTDAVAKRFAEIIKIALTDRTEEIAHINRTVGELKT